MQNRPFIADALRVAVFTGRLQQLQIAALAAELLGQLPEFSGDPIILPTDPDLPPELPRIILRDPSGSRGFQIAISRSDVYVNRAPGGQLEVEQFFAEVTRPLEALLSALNTRPSRLAATGTFFQVSDDPARALSQHFCAPGWLQEDAPMADLHSFELHTHRRYELLEGLTVNSWTRFKTGFVTEPGRRQPAIIVERDVNTLPEEASARQFDADTLRGFVTQAGAQLLPEIESHARSRQ